jgi:glutamyl-tRNA synthetase
VTVAVRFAPSPTGYLHVGNARVALVNWLLAKGRNGGFMLRLDDTDAGRSREEYAAAIKEDLLWLGLGWDRLAAQSARLAEYAAAAERLRNAGRLYACYETSEELELKRRLQLARQQPPVYDRAGLALGADERAKFEAEGRKPHWRFRLAPGAAAWDDIVRGAVSIDTSSVSDPVLVRADGVPLYTFSSVVDDVDFAITHVIRGEDHVTNTAVQLQVFAALGAKPPRFAHLALLTGGEGEGLSKREGSLSLRQLRASGIEPMAINSLLARLGTADPIEPQTELAALVAGFDLARFGRAPARFDMTELAHLNARILHATPFAAVAGRLPAGATEDFWLAARENLHTLADAAQWWAVVQGPVTPAIDDSDFAGRAAACLPAEPFDGGTWGRWTEALKADTGRKGKALYLPLRRALTGRDDGPSMHNLLPLIGPEKARARLLGETA